MNLSLSDKPALLLVDIQKGFDDVAYWGGGRNNPDAEQNAGYLLRHWRIHNLPLFHIQHCSLTPESRLAEAHAGNAFKDEVQPHQDENSLLRNT